MREFNELLISLNSHFFTVNIVVMVSFYKPKLLFLSRNTA